MICSRCKKRPAVVFVQRTVGTEIKNEGYCLTCAKELHIPQIEQMIEKFGITDEKLEAMEDNFADMMGENGMDELMKSMAEMSPEDLAEAAPEDGEDSFTPGGSPSMPFLFGGKKEKTEENKKGKKGKSRKYLDAYCENLTEKARKGQLDRIIGRDREIYRTIQILCRRQKNNPCLIGEAGVGKTAIAEGIALRIAEQKVPARLRDKEIYLLDLTSLVAGTQFRGQFESRVKGLIGEVKTLGNIILFIDEIHNITGAGDSEGAMNAANILKPALSRGEIQVIGATTFSEYRKYIEKDQALERRFQPVKIEEPSLEDAVTVIEGIKEYYEKHHYVKVSSDIVRMAVALSERYISDRFLPDKAIDLLDEACACCSLRHAEITDYVELKKKQATLQNQMKELEAQEEIDYEALADVKSELAKAEETIPELEKEVENIAVTKEDVAKVIELWTGIPALKIQQSEFTRIAQLADQLKEKIIGQDEAVDLVAAAVKRARVGISGRRRPASFIFVGPTGVGKTELVKQLASALFDSVDPLIRIDMSEYMEKHSVAKLIGSPPGYVGYDEAGQLTEKVRRKPYSVVLFDEIEKAHPDVLNILLQILDEGRITDSQGRTVNFENTIIAMTSNAGSNDRMNETGFHKTAGEMNKNKAMKALQDLLRPEFLSRVDEIVSFNTLNDEELRRICALLLDEYKKPLLEKGLGLSYTDEALKVLCKKAEGGRFGARDLRRVIRKEVEDKAADLLIEGKNCGTLTVDAREDKILVTIQ